MSSSNMVDATRSDGPPASATRAGAEFSAGSAALDNTWGFLPRLRRLTQLYAAAWTQQVSSEVTAPQFGMLSALAAEPGQDQGTLAQRLSMDKSTAADVVTRLTKRGDIRVLRDEHDSRRKVLLLTAVGRQRLDEIAPRVTELRRVAFSGFSDETRDEFIAGMDTMISFLDGATEK